MRTVRLEVEGFSTFRERLDLDFGDVDLIAFVGPTGSGKSSIIDAITFALFGSVARYDDVRLVAPVINQGANEAKVRLDFELGGSRYTAVRVVRRTKSGATTKEARLETGSAADGELALTTVLASGAKELTAAVEELLGLDFAQFTRTVVLPQGDFAEFLKDDAASRQKLLRRLLDLEMYSRMGTLARERAKQAASQMQVLQEQLDRHADATPAALADAEAKAQALEQFATEAAGVQDEVTAVDAELVELREAVASIDGHLEALSKTAVPEAVVDLGASVVAATEALTESREARDQLRRRRDEHEADVGDLADPNALKAELDRRHRAAAMSVEIEDLTPKVAESDERLTTSERALASVLTVRDEAEAKLSKMRTAADAGVWLSALVEGEPCPVCQQVVAELPDHDPSAELASVEKAANEAAAVVKQAQADADQAASSIAVQKAKLDALRNELAEAGKSIDREVSDADLTEQLSLIEAARANGAEIGTLLKAAEDSFDRAEADLSALATQEREYRSAFGSLRDALASLSPPSPSRDVLLDDWTELSTWASTQHEARQAERSEIVEKGRSLAEQKKALTTQLEEGAQPFELSISNLGASLADARQSFAVHIARMTERLGEAKKVSAQIDELNEQRTVDEMLGHQLSARGFERWLLAEALDDLVGRATVRLLELSNGQFSLTATDSSFEIIDHRNAGHVRDVRTLSGGETFLASLALALALSDSIADLAPVGAPRLESMFLDEGFGTLDPETLDVVAGAIEELSASGRLVGIVTHIEPLAERMPVRFAVSKGSNTSTVVRQTS